MTTDSSKSNFFIAWLGLFTSFGTILCCALPSLLVALGMGASFAGFIGVFPQVVWLSENKGLVFLLSGIMISISLLLTYINKNAPCHVDERQRWACTVARKWSLYIGIMSALFWLSGFIVAFVLPFLVR